MGVRHGQGVAAPHAVLSSSVREVARCRAYQGPDKFPIACFSASSRARGPAVADVAAHFAARWREVTGEQLEVTSAPAHLATCSTRFEA